MEFPLVSILVPIYRTEKYMERCARSLFSQTYPYLEFIFVDDASPDKSIQILQQVIIDYPKWMGHITILHHDKNLGLAAARNTLVDNSKGEFLLHVDSDDWIEPNAVELLVKRQIETEADIVTGTYYSHTYDNGNETISKKDIPFMGDREHALKVMLEEGRKWVTIWNKLIRSSLYREHNIRSVEGINAGEDLLTTSRLVYYSQTVAYCNHITYHYDRTNSNSYVNVFPHSWELQQQIIRACQLNVEFFRDKDVSFSDATNKLLVKRLNRVLNCTLKNRNYHGYHLVLSKLKDTDRKYWTLIGWNRFLKRWIDQHLYIAFLMIPLRNFTDYCRGLANNNKHNY